MMCPHCQLAVVEGDTHGTPRPTGHAAIPVEIVCVVKLHVNAPLSAQVVSLPDANHDGHSPAHSAGVPGPA